MICPTNCTRCIYYNNNYGASCISCEPGYGLTKNEPKSCSDLCGDGKSVSLPCDDPIDRDWDGCNDTCDPMDNFNCSKKVNFTVSCSYKLPIIMNIT